MQKKIQREKLNSLTHLEFTRLVRRCSLGRLLQIYISPRHICIKKPELAQLAFQNCLKNTWKWLAHAVVVHSAATLSSNLKGIIEIDVKGCSSRLKSSWVIIKRFRVICHICIHFKNYPHGLKKNVYMMKILLNRRTENMVLPIWVIKFLPMIIMNIFKIWWKSHKLLLLLVMWWAGGRR